MRAWIRRPAALVGLFGAMAAVAVTTSAGSRPTVVPVTAVDAAVEAELLRRVAAVPGVDLDRRTEAALAGLRP